MPKTYVHLDYQRFTPPTIRVSRLEITRLALIRSYSIYRCGCMTKSTPTKCYSSAHWNQPVTSAEFVSAYTVYSVRQNIPVQPPLDSTSHNWCLWTARGISLVIRTAGMHANHEATTPTRTNLDRICELIHLRKRTVLFQWIPHIWDSQSQLETRTTGLISLLSQNQTISIRIIWIIMTNGVQLIFI